ncbi:hypothetical protein JL721_12284 [Aureococcus anophagefferens]|nr:hypothetical protein JL721_12284 [Aureococcus anophagefferens]
MERVALLAHLPLFHECRAGLLRVAESALGGPPRRSTTRRHPATCGSAASTVARGPRRALRRRRRRRGILRRGAGALRQRARPKRARSDRAKRSGLAARSAPGASWLRDVLRASVVCDDEAAVLDAFRRLAANCDVAAVKNRFRPALNGYRDVLVTGELLTLNDLVMRTLVDYAESAPDLDRFARLLDCIGARAYAAKVRSRIDTLQQRDRDRHLWSHEAADYGAALCVSDGGADVGERDRGDDDGALEAYRAALDVYVETFGAGDKLCATPLANLGASVARWTDARTAIRRVFGPDHGSSRPSPLGRARRLAGDAGAADSPAAGVALRTAADPSPGRRWLRLARLLEAKGEAAEALVYFEQALAAFEPVLARTGTRAAVQINQ